VRISLLLTSPRVRRAWQCKVANLLEVLSLGMLASGHPIGASGAVLAARLCHRLSPGEGGLAVIPAAGGLASGLFARRLPAS